MWGNLLAEYAFPGDLLGAIRSRWDAGPALPGFALPDDDTLRRLLEACYHASLRTSEQRAVRCVVAFAPATPLTDEAPLLFESAVQLTVEQIVRLAPVADFRRTLIGCDGSGGGLRIWGIFEHGHAWAQFSSGDPPETPMEEGDLPPDCLIVAIEEPGALSVSRGRRGLVRLREGRIILPQANPLRNTADPLGRYFGGLVDALRLSPLFRDRLAAVSPAAERRSLLEVYTLSVGAILERVRSRRHGGSLVISCSPLGERLAHVTYTVAEHRGLAEEVVAYYEALNDVLGRPRPPSDTPEQLEVFRAEAVMRQASRQLMRGMNRVSLLAAVDGAVLLDDHLRTVGFGARFPVRLAPGTGVTDAATGATHACDQWGLRHQSVFSVCQRSEQAVGLIVSQDGAAKAVRSVGGRLYLWDGILD